MHSATRRPLPVLWLILVAVILIGTGLRLFRLNAVSLRGDEVFTVVHWMRQPLGETLHEIATVDPQPPLAYAAFRAWGLLFDHNDQTARLLPALYSILGIPGMYALGHRLISRNSGVIAAVLWATHPYVIWHAQDARNYALWSTVSLLALWLAFAALDRRRWRDWLSYAIVASAAAYLYYLELFILFVLTLFVMIRHWRDRRLLLQWFTALAAIGISLSVWFLQGRLLTSSGYGGTTGGFQALRLLEEFLPVLTFGVTLPYPVPLVWGVSIALLVAIAIVVLRRWHKQGAALLVGLLAVVPLVLLSLVSLRLNVFTPRYVMGAMPAFTLAISALGAWAWRHPSVGTGAGIWARAGGSLLLVVVALVNLFSLNNLYLSADYAKSPDWRTLTQYLSHFVTADDIVIQAAADEAFNYYFEQSGVAGDRKQLPANPQQSTAEITALLAADERTKTSLWRTAQTFPDWANYGVVEGWLDANMQRVLDTQVAGLRVQQYRRWDVGSDEMGSFVSVPFGEVATLADAHILPLEQSPGTLTVWLYWHADAQTAQPLKGFVHLVGAVNPATGTPLWAQHDQPVQDGRVSTTSWNVGRLYRDVYRVALADVPPGTYEVHVGLYDQTTGERLLSAEGDSLVLQIIEIGS